MIPYYGRYDRDQILNLGIVIAVIEKHLDDLIAFTNGAMNFRQQDQDI